MKNLIRYFLPIVFLLIGGIYLGKGIVSLSPGIMMALIGGAVLGGLSFFRPEIGVYFILFSTLFFPEVPVGAVGMGLTAAERDIGIRPEDILIILIAVGWFARLVARREIMTIPHTPINLPIIMLSFIMILATLLGVLLGDVSGATGFFYTLKRLEYFLIFFMVIGNLKTEQEVKTGIILLLVFAAIVALVGISEHLTKPLARISGPFRGSQANILGGFLVIIVFLALSFLIKYRSMTLRAGLLALILISLYTIIWTRSRSSYASIFMGFIIFSLLARRPFLLIIPICLIIFMQYLFPQPVHEAALSIRAVWSAEEFNPSWASRIDAWQSAIPMIFSRPFLGYGLGAFDLAWSDNQYVLDALSMGLIGLGVFIWLLIRMFRSVWEMYRNSPELYNQALALGFVCGLCGLLIQGIAISNFYTIRTMVPFWFLTGLVMVTRNIEIEKRGKEMPTEMVEPT